MKYQYCFLISAATLAIMTACHKDKEETVTPPPPVKVDVMVVGQTDRQHSDDLTSNVGQQVFAGTVSADNTAVASFAVPGTIQSLYVSEGQKVSAGQTLAQLQTTDYTSAYNIAAAQLDEAEDAYRRLQKLHDANALPDIKWVEIQQKVKQARNAADMAAHTVKQATLTAPISGTVTRRIADTGQNVIPGQPIYEITSTQNLTIDIAVPQQYIANVRIGQPASFTIDSYPQMQGKVTQKEISADPLTRTYKVKISIPASEKSILPGMTGNVRLNLNGNIAENNTSDASQVMSGPFNLPSQAVILGNDNKNYVWCVTDGKAERRAVTTDFMTADGVTVTAGLNDGDTVIIAGMQKVSNGTPVTVQK